jgi:hypothetical protein
MSQLGGTMAETQGILPPLLSVGFDHAATTPDRTFVWLRYRGDGRL